MSLFNNLFHHIDEMIKLDAEWILNKKLKDKENESETMNSNGI